MLSHQLITPANHTFPLITCQPIRYALSPANVYSKQQLPLNFVTKNNMQLVLLTVLTRSISSPRAARSVAIRTTISPSLNFLSASSRCHTTITSPSVTCNAPTYLLLQLHKTLTVPFFSLFTYSALTAGQKTTFLDEFRTSIITSDSQMFLSQT